MSDNTPEKLEAGDKLITKTGRPMLVKPTTKKNDFGEPLYKLIMVRWTDPTGWIYPTHTLSNRLTAQEMWNDGIRRYKEEDKETD